MCSRSLLSKLVDYTGAVHLHPSQPSVIFDSFGKLEQAGFIRIESPENWWRPWKFQSQTAALSINEDTDVRQVIAQLSLHSVTERWPSGRTPAIAMSLLVGKVVKRTPGPACSARLTIATMVVAACHRLPLVPCTRSPRRAPALVSSSS